MTCRTFILFKKSNFLVITNFGDNDNVMTSYIEISAKNIT